MRPLFSLFLCFLCLSAYSSNKTFNKLAEVNKCWHEQTDVVPDALPAYADRSEREWIRTHLSLVEATLRQRDVHYLSPQQQHNRMQCLDDLHTYWQTGNFPVNDLYAYRTPIFIDRYNNFCAVGYLVKTSGSEHISRMIAAKTNLAYVREMNYPELNAWAGEHGFTTDELAWIQPGYPPTSAAAPVGGGVNGTVNELYADNAAGILYVGGSFTKVDGSIEASNIAYVTEDGGAYTWHKMGTGASGQVYAITKYSDKIFAAGVFEMGDGPHTVAWWDGSAWQAAGCLQGSIRDLVVFEGALYACGELDDCTGLFAPQYFAKWDGTSWHSIDGPWGRINTMEVMGSSLVLGGAFSYMGTPVNVIKWNPTTSFVPLVSGLNNEVNDLEVYSDTLYAACKRTHATDTTSLFMRLRPTGWATGFLSEHTMDMVYPYAGALNMNTLCGEPTGLNLGGQFSVYPMIGDFATNAYNVGDYGNWATVDGAVNKMTLFKGQLYMAGAFVTGGTGGWGGSNTVNGIARRKAPTTHVPLPADVHSAFVYPSPVHAGAPVAIENNFKAQRYALHDVTGRAVATGAIDNTSKVAIPQTAPGIYMMTLSNEAGAKVVRKIVVE